MTLLQAARSVLFVPAHRPDRYAKAGASGADLVCIDLDDAVPPAARAAARSTLVAWLGEQPLTHPYGVRLNGLHTADGLRDLLALQDAAARPAFVMLAKAESANDMTLLAAQLPGLPLVALIESARGLRAAADIAAVHPQVQALMLGGADLAADLGCAFAWEPLLHARATLVLAAATAVATAAASLTAARSLAVWDVPWLDIDDAAGCQAETARAVALGCTAKAVIHPAQVAAVHAGLCPTPQALVQARQVVQAARENTGAFMLEGRMVDRPVLLAAQRVLRLGGDRIDTGG